MENRRPLKTRSQKWAHQCAGLCVKAGLTPNIVSLLSIAFAFAGFILCLLLESANPLLWLCFAVTMQLRLLCNMIDGMMAIENQMKSKTGDLFNEIPDRLADVLFILGFTFTLRDHGLYVWLGNLVCISAVMTAYIRALGGSLGLKQNFTGPMAKPHRMALLTFCSLINTGSLLMGFATFVPALNQCALIILLAGTVLTCYRRITLIYVALNAR